MRGLLWFLPDPIKWLDDLGAVLRYGPGVKIAWVFGPAWPGLAVESVLLRYGVRVLRRDYGHGKQTAGVYVPKDQAAWADWLLRRAGCPVVSPALSAVEAGAMPAAWGVPARPVGLAGALVRAWAPVPSGRRDHSGRRPRRASRGARGRRHG